MSKVFLSRKEGGSVIVIVALVMGVLVGFVGLTIDFGYAYVQKTRLQSMLDATALGCGQKGTCVTGLGSLPDNLSVISPLIAPFDVDPSQIVINTNAACPAPTTGNDCIQISTSMTWDSFFISMFGVHELTVNASAMAVGGGSEPPPDSSPALMALRSNGQGVFLNGAGQFGIQGDLVSNSTSPGMTVWSNNVAVDGDVIAASSSLAGFGIPPGNVTGEIKLNTVTEDPCEGEFTAPVMGSCVWSSEALSFCKQKGPSSWAPDPAVTYCRLDLAFERPNCTLTLAGTIRVRDGIAIGTGGSGNNLTIDGSAGVTFYVENGNFQLSIDSNNNAAINIAAPTSGPYEGLTVWQAASTSAWSSHQTVFNLGRMGAFSVSGLIYAPSSSFIGGVSSNSPPSVFPSVIVGQAQVDTPVPVSFQKAAGVCGNSSGSGTTPGGGSTGSSRLVR